MQPYAADTHGIKGYNHGAHHISVIDTGARGGISVIFAPDLLACMQEAQPEGRGQKGKRQSMFSSIGTETRRVAFLASLVVLCGSLAACDDVTSDNSAPERRVVSLGMLEGSESWQVLLHEPEGSRQLTGFETSVTNLQPLAPPLLAFETVTDGRKEIYFLNAKLGLYERRLSLAASGGWPEVLVEPRGTAYVITEPGPFGELLFLKGIPPNDLQTLLATFRFNVMPIAWSCSRQAVFLLDQTNNRMKRLDIETRELTDLPQDDWRDFNRHHHIGSFATSCDERTTAIGVYANGNSKVFIYRDGQRIASIEDEAAIEPYVSKDGGTVYYVARYGEPLNTVMAYDIETGEAREVVGPVAAMGLPIPIEAER